MFGHALWWFYNHCKQQAHFSLYQTMAWHRPLVASLPHCWSSFFTQQSQLMDQPRDIHLLCTSLCAMWQIATPFPQHTCWFLLAVPESPWNACTPRSFGSYSSWSRSFLLLQKYLFTQQNLGNSNWKHQWNIFWTRLHDKRLPIGLSHLNQNGSCSKPSPTICGWIIPRIIQSRLQHW
jgi:hypothetical protein